MAREKAANPPQPTMPAVTPAICQQRDKNTRLQNNTIFIPYTDQNI